VKRFHDCDAVTLARANGAGAPGGASETVVGRFVHAGVIEGAFANPAVGAFAVVEDERTAVDFFADERALGCALPSDKAGAAAVAEADLGKWPTAGPRETQNERPEPGIRASGRRRRSAPDGRAPAQRVEPAAAAAEVDGARRAPARRPFRSMAPKTMFMSTLGCIALLSGAALIVYPAWPLVPRQATSQGVIAATTTPGPVARGAPPSCAAIPIIAATSAAPPVPTLPTALPAAPTASFPYDERAAAVAFMVALAAAHPSDEAYREAARILRSTTKDAREARR
jgi:hypothetical protein